MPWLDAHLDLACLAVGGRDMTIADPVKAGGPFQPGSVTIPTLLRSGVPCALATIFTEADGDGPEGYPFGDEQAAHRRGRAQLEAYLTWRDMGLVKIDLPDALRQDKHVGEIRGGMGVTELVQQPAIDRLAKDGSLHIGILMECADPIRKPEKLEWWAERGVMMIGMAWWRGSRYAGGNGTPGVGLADIGKDLADAMDQLGVLHDLSHLSQQATDDLLAHTDALVVASHSNCRALVDDDERHLADDTIVEIGRRGGVVGINLVSAFLRAGIAHDGTDRASVQDVIAHIERVCGLMGRKDGVGLGSDMDGGFSRERLPEGINGPADLELLATALRAHGWTDAEIEGFRWKNWAEVLTKQRAAAKTAG